MTKKLDLTIGWLYPDLMSTYGDRGNIIALKKRSEWRDIDVRIEEISVDTTHKKVSECDLLFMGGAQDTQQEIVNEDLLKNKGKYLSEKIENTIPGLFICGAYQFLGKYYKTAEGLEIPGLAILPLYTENPGENTERLIGNIIIQPKYHMMNYEQITGSYLVGFENHGGRTYLDHEDQAFAKVLHGFGNNGDDETEGVVYKNAIGTYLHGPILPKNPRLADALIYNALEVKYKESIPFKELDDTMENQAKEVIVKRYNL